MTKKAEQMQALELRKRGISMKEIARTLGVSVGSVHLWVHQVELSPEFRVRLAQKGRQALPFLHASNKEKFAARILRERMEADSEWDSLKTSPAFMFGLALYIGEGAKTGGCIGVANCDPAVLRASVNFMLALGCSPEILRCLVVLHRGEDPEKAVSYWSRELGLPKESFYRVTTSKVSGGKRARHLIHGTASIRACHASIKRKLNRWMELAKKDFGSL
jgi:transposase-like protein